MDEAAGAMHFAAPTRGVTDDVGRRQYLARAREQLRNEGNNT
jgi:hypothetical protein